MFKNWLKQVVVVLMSLIIIVSPFSMLTVHADDYKKNDSDEDNGATYYIIEGENVNSLFDFGISDVGDLYQWIWSFHTFTVIKKCSDGTYKCYFNTPNLQQLVKNQVVEFVPDGYTDSTYDINQTQVILIWENILKKLCLWLVLSLPQNKVSGNSYGEVLRLCLVLHS